MKHFGAVSTQTIGPQRFTLFFGYRYVSFPKLFQFLSSITSYLDSAGLSVPMDSIQGRFVEHFACQNRLFIRV